MVDELFRFIRTSTEALGGELQVQVLGHFAVFEEPWFDEALVDNWRDGKGLLPADWLSGRSTALALRPAQGAVGISLNDRSVDGHADL